MTKAIWFLSNDHGILDHRLDLWSPCGASDEDNLVNVALIDATVVQALLDRAHGNAEVIHVKFFTPCTRQSAREIDAIEERVTLDRRLCG